MAALWPRAVASFGLLIASGQAAAVALTAPASEAAPPALLGVKKSDAGPLGGHWYATAELRYHINTYYGPDGRYSRQEPSTHARLQVGSQFYGGMVDAYATLGVFKEPHSQQMLQRRPELALDIYPVKYDYFTLLQYNLVKFPIRQEDAGHAPDDEKDDYSDATVTLVGLAPTVKIPLLSGPSRLDLKGGLDGWTKLYSRKQYTGYHPAGGAAPDDEHLELTSDAPGASSTATPTQTEDFALHYQAQAIAGVALAPAFVKPLTSEVTVHYHSQFDPVYTQAASGTVDVRYGVERYSYVRFRLHYDFNERVAISNDFYSFREGFFAGERPGTEWRYRNIARITCRL